MSNSSNSLSHKQIIRARLLHSSEPPWEARCGVRGRLIGFDTDDRAQQRMRAQLALMLLNSAEPPQELVEADDNRGHLWRDIYGLMVNSLVFSPRFNDLAVFSDMPGHFVGKIHNFPGIRLERVDWGHDALVLKHLPTGGNLSFRYWPNHRPRMRERCPQYTLLGKVDSLRQTPELEDEEKLALSCMPAMTEDAERLLAGLVSRLYLHSPTERWAVGALIDDPLRRPRPKASPFGFTYCWGRGRDWVVRWGGGRHAVPAEDVARALTHPVVGLAKATIGRQERDRADVYFGDATLRLERHFPRDRWPHGGVE
ncbi:hypothetical protein ACWCW7_29670 [Nocardia tengchongensis]